MPLAGAGVACDPASEEAEEVDVEGDAVVAVVVGEAIAVEVGSVAVVAEADERGATVGAGGTLAIGGIADGAGVCT